MNINRDSQSVNRWWVLIALSCALASRADVGNPKRELNEARREAWTLARSTVDKLRRTGGKPGAGKDSGIADWIVDFDRVAAKIDPTGPPERWRPLGADALAGRNPKFWRAIYEAPPADPMLTMLHASLLLAAGEATRARYVLVLAAQHPQLTPEQRKAYRGLAARAEAAGRQSQALVLEAVQLRYGRDFPAVLEKLADALIHWPQNAAAHWEIGRTLREQAWEASRNLDLPDAPEIGAALERARQHDPLLLEAYQGGDPALRKNLMALMQTQGTAWLRLARDPDRPAETTMLARLAGALQRAGVDELALVAYQTVRARRGNSDPADQQFISSSLRALGTITPGQTAP